MHYYSTTGSEIKYSLTDAVLTGLPEDNGLFMPEIIPLLPKSFFTSLKNYSLPEIAFIVATAFLKNDLSSAVIRSITDKAVTFDAPVKELSDDTAVLELFHGPTLAFKDFGARFMAQLMSKLIQKNDKIVTILVATSGDTGGAVANGFYNTEGIEVIILYPSGKVSQLQEKQLTTLGGNITALEIDGTFDDCQRLVKSAFLDNDLTTVYNLSSANSINIARLIPQTFYYFEAFKLVQYKNKPVIFSVPSGNFGNLTAGVIAKKMGLPIHKFIAAVNANTVFSEYINTGKFVPGASVKTMSNAMDVGAPSNFSRLLSIYKHDLEKMKKDILSCSNTDEETRSAIHYIYNNYNYVADPHGAVAWLGWEKFRYVYPDSYGIFFETAHPSKFAEEMAGVISLEIKIPDNLRSLMMAEKKSVKLSTGYPDFKEYLLTGK